MEEREVRAKYKTAIETTKFHQLHRAYLHRFNGTLFPSEFLHVDLPPPYVG